ncbi:hypothetical protein ACFSTC_33615 [Nonomuraea ferruginea]
MFSAVLRPIPLVLYKGEADPPTPRSRSAGHAGAALARAAAVPHARPGADGRRAAGPHPVPDHLRPGPPA